MDIRNYYDSSVNVAKANDSYRVVWGYMKENSLFTAFEPRNQWEIEKSYQQSLTNSRARKHIKIFDSTLPEPLEKVSPRIKEAKIHFGFGGSMHLRMPQTRNYVKRKVYYPNGTLHSQNSSPCDKHNSNQPKLSPNSHKITCTKSQPTRVQNHPYTRRDNHKYITSSASRVNTEPSYLPPYAESMASTHYSTVTMPSLGHTGMVPIKNEYISAPCLTTSTSTSTIGSQELYTSSFQPTIPAEVFSYNGENQAYRDAPHAAPFSKIEGELPNVNICSLESFSLNNNRSNNTSISNNGYYPNDIEQLLAESGIYNDASTESNATPSTNASASPIDYYPSQEKIAASLFSIFGQDWSSALYNSNNSFIGKNNDSILEDLFLPLIEGTLQQ